MGNQPGATLLLVYTLLEGNKARHRQSIRNCKEAAGGLWCSV